MGLVINGRGSQYGKFRDMVMPFLKFVNLVFNAARKDGCDLIMSAYNAKNLRKMIYVVLRIALRQQT